VLEGHPFERVGGSQPIKVDVRVIAATNRDLEKAVAEGSFRRDLYFRLRVVEIFVPPLRKRPEDIIELANYFLDRYIVETGRKIRGFTPEALHLMQQYRWPGNVRELKNVLLRAAALAQEGIIKRSDVAGEGTGFRGTVGERNALDLSGKFSDAKDRAIERFEQAYLSALMRRCAGNLSKASREADVARHHLRELLKKRGLYGISLGDDEGQS
jgi:Nif-specific regulatory protein